MSERPRFAFLNGAVVPFSEATLPLDDRGVLFAESLYEVTAITAGKPRLLPEHVARMRRAAAELELGAGVPELAAWERLAADLTAREGVRDGLLYAQVTGGAAPRDFVPSPRPSPNFFAYAKPHPYPRHADVARGIRVASSPDLRWGRRDLKTTMLLPAVLAKSEVRRRGGGGGGGGGATEALFVAASGEVNEGGSSNVFLVEGRVLFTPAQSTSLLPGTMRPLVAAVAAEAGLEVRSERLMLERFYEADEAFITSTTQLAMPIVALDGRTIGTGSGGPIALDLARRLRARFELAD